ncbi:MAG: hypothetical protein U1E36_01750 [Rickettsiales bacterium]
MISTPDSSVRSRQQLIPATPSRIARKNTATIEPVDRDTLKPPRFRGLPYIPSEDTLRDLIDRALQALRHGIFWDRGSILNIVV